MALIFRRWGAMILDLCPPDYRPFGLQISGLTLIEVWPASG